MAISKTANLALFPALAMGHLIPAVELAKRLVAGNPNLAVTFLLINQSNSGDTTRQSYLRSLRSDAAIAAQGITFSDLPPIDGGFDSNSGTSQAAFKSAVEDLRAAGPAPLAGVVLDLFHSAMIDVAAEIDLPCYIYFTGGAACLSMMFHLQETGIDLAAEYERRPHAAVEFPVFKEPMPMKALPEIGLNKATSAGFLRHPERFRRAKGILLNSFTELEEGFIHYMAKKDDLPTIYPVGPIINVNPPEKHAGNGTGDSIFAWLDEQPPASVVFLCFGSNGSFEEKQLREIAIGLERSGRRFLWSIRQRPEGSEAPSDYEDVSSVLPEGFMERTAGRGRVIGWAPQTAVLGHVAVGAFVSHCGWNSTLESLWFGVPMAAWPLYAEQQFNARLLVREMGLAAKVRLDYRQGEKVVVEAAEVEEGIRGVADEADEAAAEIRKRAEEMSVEARKALEKGGSSYLSIGRFVEALFQNIDSHCLAK